MIKFFQNLNDFNKAVKTHLRLGLYSWYCPFCTPERYLDYDKPTGRVGIIKDEKYHKYKFYIKCSYCNRTTPAFEDPKKIFDTWEDLYISQEVKTVLGEKESR